MAVPCHVAPVQPRYSCERAHQAGWLVPSQQCHPWGPLLVMAAHSAQVLQPVHEQGLLAAVPTPLFTRQTTLFISEKLPEVKKRKKTGPLHYKETVALQRKWACHPTRAWLAAFRFYSIHTCFGATL